MSEMLSAKVELLMSIKRLVKDRDQAKADLDYDSSDHIRERLVNEFGVEIVEQKGGPSGWRFKDKSSTKFPSGTVLPASYLEYMKSGPKPTSAPSSSTKVSVPNPSKRPRNKDEDAAQDSGKKKKKREETKETNGDEQIQKKKKEGALVPKIKSNEQNRNSSLLSSLIPANPTLMNVQGVLIQNIQTGSGPAVKIGDRIKVYYIGRLKSGKVFDSSLKKPFVFRVGKGEVRNLVNLLSLFICLMIS